MERQHNDDHNSAQVAQGDAGSGHWRTNPMPIGLAAGHSLLIATGTDRNRIAAQTLPYNTAARNAFLRLCSTIDGRD
jgi:hypothetical protein